MKIPDYEVLQLCGQGAYGEVWLARNRSGQMVALKLIKHATGIEKEFAGLVNYAKLKTSPHLIRILHTGETEELLYYTMEPADNLGTDRSYIPATLANLLHQRERLSPQETLTLGIQLLDGLKTLHDAGLVHRDVKPENILYVDGSPKLSDIGLVRRISQTLSLGGTLGFLPPERLRSGSSGKNNAEDLYALGKVLYCTVTGNPVEEFPSFPPELICSKECRRLNAVILTACDPVPVRRFHNAAEFSHALTNGIPTGKRLFTVLHKLRYLLLFLLLILFLLLRYSVAVSNPPAPSASHVPPSAINAPEEQTTPVELPRQSRTRPVRKHSAVKDSFPAELPSAESAEKIPQAQIKPKSQPENLQKRNWLTERSVGFDFRNGMIQSGNDGYIQWKNPLSPPCRIRFQLLVDTDFDEGEFRSKENSACFTIQLVQPGKHNRNISQIQFHLQKNARGILCWRSLEYQSEDKPLQSFQPLAQPAIEHGKIQMELVLEYDSLSVLSDGNPLFHLSYKKNAAPVFLRFKTAYTIVGDVRIKDFSVFSEKKQNPCKKFSENHAMSVK